MKKTLLTLALVVSTVAAFAQGKITLGNDSLHLITDGSAPVPLNGFTDLTLQLMGGTSAGSMVLQTTLVGNAINSLAVDPGRINNTTFTMLGVGTAVQATLQLYFFSSAAGSYQNALNNPGLYRSGASPVFTVTTGSFAYNSIVLHGAPGNSTWADAPLVVPGGVVPEPSSMALAGLGAASLLLFRRRK
jgi:hypothetical protein